MRLPLIFFRFQIIIILITGIVFFSACTIETEEVFQDVQSESISDIANLEKPSFLNSIIKWQNSIMDLFSTKSTEFVLISDPFFASNFMGNSALGYDEFYLNTNREGHSERLFVIIEDIFINNSAVPSHQIAIGDQFINYTSLKKMDWLFIKYAERVVLSPLFEIFAPEHYQQIIELRKQDRRQVQTIIYDENILHPDYISIDYSDAIFEMGKLAGKLAEEKNSETPTINMFLDANQVAFISHRISYFLKGIYTSSSKVIVNQNWLPQERGNEYNALEKIEKLNRESIVFVDLGIHTYSVLSQLINRNISNREVWENRLFMLQFFPTENTKYQLPVYASIEIPHIKLFEKNNHINAVLRRYKY